MLALIILPGDFTPPSRFVRAVAFQQATPPLATEHAAIYQAFHILNNFDIPYGSVRDADGTIEYTTWTSAIDLHNKTFYWRTHDNFQLQRASLMDMDLDAQAPSLIPMAHHDEIIDVTPLLKKLTF